MKQTDSHHIIPKRFKTGSKETVEVTPDEHRRIHTLQRLTKTKDEALAAHITARLNKKYKA